MSSILKVSEIQDPTNGNTALSIDTSGNVKTKSIYVGASVTGLQTVTNNTATLINFDQQVASNGLSWDTTNKKCTFNSDNAGTYLISVRLAFFSGSNTFQQAMIDLYRGSTRFRNTLCLINGTGGGTTLGAVRHILGVSEAIHTFSSGDEFSVKGLLQVGSGTAYVHEQQYGSELHLIRLGD